MNNKYAVHELVDHFVHFRFNILFIKYNTITNSILIIYEPSNFNHVLGVVSQARFCDANRNHDNHAGSLEDYQIEYQGTLG